MPKGFHHLTHDLRCQIYTLKTIGLSQADIARRLQVSASTLSRELKRNRGPAGILVKKGHNSKMRKLHD